MIKGIILFLICFINLLFGASANYNLSTHEIFVGIPVDLNLEIIYSKDNPLLTAPDINASPEIFIRSIDRKKEILGNKIKEIITYKIQFFGIGQGHINPIQIVLKNKNKILIPTYEITVKGTITKKDTKEIMDIRPVIPIYYTNKELLLFFAILSGIFLILFLLYWFLKHRKKDKKQIAEVENIKENILSPIDEARKLFSEAKSLINNGKYQEFYYSLSNILRRYFGRVLNLPLLENTTMKVYDMLLPHIKEEEHKKIKYLLNAWDEIKYAAKNTYKEKAIDDLNYIINLIESYNKRYLDDTR